MSKMGEIIQSHIYNIPRLVCPTVSFHSIVDRRNLKMWGQVLRYVIGQKERGLKPFKEKLPISQEIATMLAWGL